MDLDLDLALDHLHLRSPDPDATARFYVDMLGAAVTARDETPASLRVSLVVGGAALFIDRVPGGTAESPDPPHLGIEHIGFKVVAIDAAVAGLAARGVEIVTAPHEVRPGLRIAFLRGPENVRIELLQRG